MPPWRDTVINRKTICLKVNERQMDLSTETLDVRYSPIPMYFDAWYDIADCWRKFKGKIFLTPTDVTPWRHTSKQQLERDICL